MVISTGSAGAPVLGVLISGLNYAQQQGRIFTVVNPSSMARRILGLTGLDESLIGSCSFRRATVLW
jgi:anti-sigma B factor antagonist